MGVVVVGESPETIDVKLFANMIRIECKMLVPARSRVG